MDHLIAGDLKIEARDGSAPPSIQLFWTGKSNDRQPARILGPFFSTVLAQAAERRLPVEMHFEKLEHFNSSTITSIIQLIQEARNKTIRVVIVYDAALKWQKLSFDALRVFAKDELLEFRTL